MKSLRRRILLDALAPTPTVVLATVGVSLLLLSPVLGTGAGLVGVVGVLGAAGIAATNLIFNLEKITERVLLVEQERRRQEREVHLDRLSRRLQRNGDPVDDETFRNLRALYATYQENRSIRTGLSAEVSGRIEQIFDACVTNLDRQHRLLLASNKAVGPAKEVMTRERQVIITEVQKSVESLSQAVNEIHGLRLKSEQGELQKLRQSLGDQLEVAREVDRRMAELEKNDWSRFSEYE